MYGSGSNIMSTVVLLRQLETDLPLFLPEAAVAMQDIVPRSDCSGLNPDFVMRGDEGETA